MHFGESPETIAALITGCYGYVTLDGIVVLEIGEALPHMKTEMSGVVLEHWQSCIHAAIGKLAEQSVVPHFQKAMVGIHIAMPHGADNTRVWDTSNRAINLVLNNLKGIFFSDDDIEHMAFMVVGSWSDEPVTRINIGDFETQLESVTHMTASKQIEK